MSNSPLKISITGCFLMISLAGAQTQETVVKISPICESEVTVLRNVPHWKFTTKAYQEEAVRLMLKEANRVAALLPLHEQLPIREADLIERYVSPPSMVGLGWIATTNFNYIFDRKFFALSRRDMVARFYEAKAKYSWPIDRMDKQRAFETATNLMATVSIDVARLNRDFRIEITTPETEGLIRKHFFPHYWVNWRNKSGQAVAYIEFVEPTQYILQLDCRNMDYILREPIAIPNLAALLNQTNAPSKP